VRGVAERIDRRVDEIAHVRALVGGAARCEEVERLESRDEPEHDVPGRGEAGRLAAAVPSG
jgi:hypothetical protein